MGFIPLCSASKLCELERRGACLYPVLGIVVCAPFFSEEPVSAGPEHFCSLFGLPALITGCSVIGRVAVRCTDWNTAAKSAPRLDFIVQAKLAFLVQCYPKSLEGMPIGTRLGTIELCLCYLLTLIRLSANMYLQTGIKSKGDCADVNMTIDYLQESIQ